MNIIEATVGVGLIPVVIWLFVSHGQLRSEITSLIKDCERNRADIVDEKHRNDKQDGEISQIMQILSRIDVGVSQLLQTVGLSK